jgi:hypothetical protein
MSADKPLAVCHSNSDEGSSQLHLQHTLQTSCGLLCISAGKPLAVCHSNSDKGSAEVSSAGMSKYTTLQTSCCLLSMSAGKPLAVCHSNSDKGSAEVSSANYEARAFGIRAGMFMAEAKSRCPALIVVPYEFEKYEEVSEQVSHSPTASGLLMCCRCSCT